MAATRASVTGAYVGTSGFSYPSWRGGFYPEKARPGEFLELYAELLPSVELNTTFYSLPAEEHLRLFLMQYWGGPRTYDELRGHPRLRMRHVRFAIGEAERDAWLRHMRDALDELALDPALDAQLWDYLVMAAHSLVNVEPAHRGDLGLTPA